MTNAHRWVGWAIGLLPITVAATNPGTDPSVDEQGTIRATVEAPVSKFLSAKAKAHLTERLRNPPQVGNTGDIEAIRANVDQRSKKVLDAWLDIHAVVIEDTEINGVHVHVVTPEGGIAPENNTRILINAHSGGFLFGAKYGGQIEAVPMAAYGRVKVIAVDYRLAPEYQFPAASEDMEAVYRYALEHAPAENIGIYGCSAGGTLTAQMVPWLLEKKLPLPGAIGVFCSGAAQNFWYGGDSEVVARLLNAVPSSAGDSNQAKRPRDYFDGIAKNSPLVAPGEFPEVLAKFPPTLVVTGTRDIAMSNALMTHTRLLTAGAAAELFVQEGLGHGHFATLPGTPEAETAHNIIWSFFHRHLGR